MFKGPGKIVRDNKSLSYPVFELTGVNCSCVGLPHLSQESMVLSQLQLTYLSYLELPLTVLQSYRITAFPLKHQKVEQQQQNR